MKKLLLSLAIILSIFACKKQTTTPQPPPPVNNGNPPSYAITLTFNSYFKSVFPDSTNQSISVGDQYDPNAQGHHFWTNKGMSPTVTTWTITLLLPPPNYTGNFIYYRGFNDHEHPNANIGHGKSYIISFFCKKDSIMMGNDLLGYRINHPINDTIIVQ